MWKLRLDEIVLHLVNTHTTYGKGNKLSVVGTIDQEEFRELVQSTWKNVLQIVLIEFRMSFGGANQRKMTIYITNWMTQNVDDGSSFEVLRARDRLHKARQRIAVNVAVRTGLRSDLAIGGEDLV